MIYRLLRFTKLSNFAINRYVLGCKIGYQRKKSKKVPEFSANTSIIRCSQNEHLVQKRVKNDI